MADLNRLSRLFSAIAARDWVGAETEARAVASAEERIGHHVAAQRLRGALQRSVVDAATSGPKVRETALGIDGVGGVLQFLTSALHSLPATRTLASIMLRDKARLELRTVVDEWAKRDVLAKRGIGRRSKLLFHGPPGCGKSAAARALGFELGLPVSVVRFDAVVGAFLGQTALHLRQLFQYAESVPSILLIDEIDALGKRRGSPLDVGELDRVVIALLQELEHSHPSGLLIATSNLGRHLDEALWRRFDLVVEFPRPNQGERRQFATEQFKLRSITPTSRNRSQLARAKTYADVERIVDEEERRLALES